MTYIEKNLEKIKTLALYTTRIKPVKQKKLESRSTE